MPARGVPLILTVLPLAHPRSHSSLPSDEVIVVTGRIVPIAWVLAFSARLALAESSGMVSYRGVLSDRAGNPIQGPVELTFRIYDSRTGGNLVAGPFGPL